MRNVGTIVRGIRTPIIKEGDDLANIVVNSIMNASQSEKFEIENQDIIGITEAVVGITEGNYVTLDQIAKDIQNKFGADHIGILFPSPMSRNRFTPYLKGIARGLKKITMQVAYPEDEEGNKLFDEELLEIHNVNPYSDTLNEEEYKRCFGGHKHVFTGVDYISYFREVVESEDCEIEYVFSNNPKVITEYADHILICNVHNRFKNKKIISNTNVKKVLCLDEIMNESVDSSGCNPKYGLLGSNRATDEKLKLFPAKGQDLVEKIQKRIKELTGKEVEVLVYGDGAFKDPVGGIWELADPVVSPAYTKGLEGTPNEIKIKYISDNKLSDLNGDELVIAMKNEIKAKEKDLTNNMMSQGTTPRRYTDLIGSLCDLTTGSGDKGTPVVYIQRYFTNYADE